MVLIGNSEKFLIGEETGPCYLSISPYLNKYYSFFNTKKTFFKKWEIDRYKYIQGNDDLLWLKFKK